MSRKRRRSSESTASSKATPVDYLKILKICRLAFGNENKEEATAAIKRAIHHARFDTKIVELLNKAADGDDLALTCYNA
jgi:hypothetical protein